MNMNISPILFVSQLYPDKLVDRLRKESKVGLDYAADNLSRAINKGFEENRVPVSVLNIPHLNSYPIYSKTLIVEACKEGNVYSLPYTNFIYLKRQSMKRRAKSFIRDWCKKNGGNGIILLYGFEQLSAAVEVKKLYPNLKIILIVTDLIAFMDVRRDIVSILNKTKIFSRQESINTYCKEVDGFVLLASDMKNKLPVNDKPWIRIEGIYNDTQLAENVEKQEKTIMYTGNLGNRYGVPMLLDAFSKIEDKGYRLWLRGGGELQEMVIEAAAKDPRITYYGQLSRKDLITLQKKATLLVNPVPSNQDFTHYFFPSKTMEYLASGTATLMTKLTCVPPEYDQHLFYLEDETTEGLKTAMMRICEMAPTTLAEHGEKASEFIRREKTPKPQIGKLIEFLKTIE